LGTKEGVLACGDVGKGKLLPWEEIVQYIKDIMEKQDRYLKI
jgi:phosphopantothenoylcysteine synthetase/decarboxylase